MDIDASCEEVFDVIHDYGIRLQWDTLLSKACIVDGRPRKLLLGCVRSAWADRLSRGLEWRLFTSVSIGPAWRRFG